MSDIGICRFCKHIDKDIVQNPCLHCSANMGAFEFDLSDYDKQIRDEVIDEIHKRLEEEIKTNPKVIYVDNKDYLSVARGSVLEVIHDTLEQMKGEQNE